MANSTGIGPGIQHAQQHQPAHPGHGGPPGLAGAAAPAVWKSRPPCRRATRSRRPSRSPTSARRTPAQPVAGRPGRFHHARASPSGSSIVALYSITTNIPPASAVPPGGTIAAFSQTLSPLDNVFTFTAPAVTLPTSPSDVFPRRRGRPLRQDPRSSACRRTRWPQIHTVGPPVNGPAAGRRRVDAQLQRVPVPADRHLHRHQSDVDDHVLGDTATNSTLTNVGDSTIV